ncbi:MAG TPA: hypothetical protein VJI52_05560 [Candidatus Nanoarchaeia archaeon]|nr:hypothetical protein [Candidatus Nanoarchaeia archaeon]
MNKPQVICHSCKKPIKSDKDLVTALYVFLVMSYHSACYSNRLKSIETVFLKNYPVNGVSGTLSAVIAPIFGLFISIVLISAAQYDTEASYWQYILLAITVLAISSLPIVFRAYSYYTYERPLR